MAEEKAEKEAGRSSNLKIIIIVVIVTALVVGGAVGATLFFLGGDKAEATAEGDEAAVVEEDKGPAIYQSLDPKFVVSFTNPHSARFMQFSVDVVTHKDEVKEQVKLHLPAIRSSLLMIIGEQGPDEMSTREGKQKLLEEIRQDVNKTLERMEGKKAIKDGIEAAYFNSFVIQ